MIEHGDETIPVELMTDTAWIFGRLSPSQSSDPESLTASLHLADYGLSRRSLIEYGRLVDVLNRGLGYLLLNGAWIQPHSPLDLLDRTLDRLAVNIGEVLCAAPPQPASDVWTSDGDPPAARERRRVELQVGSLLVKGELHVAPGADPIVNFFNSQREFVPLTRATAVYLPAVERQWQRDVLCVSVRRTQFMVATDTEAQREQLAILRGEPSETAQSQSE